MHSLNLNVNHVFPVYSSNKFKVAPSLVYEINLKLSSCDAFSCAVNDYDYDYYFGACEMKCRYQMLQTTLSVCLEIRQLTLN
jgi:hypothetical protein